MQVIKHNSGSGTIFSVTESKASEVTRPLPAAVMTAAIADIYEKVTQNFGFNVQLVSDLLYLVPGY
jgi:hypothetical protein